MQAGQLFLVRTDPATQFTGALAQNAAATLNMTMPTAGAVQADGFVDGGLMAGKVGKARLKSLTLVSVENLAWELWLWGKSTFQGDNDNPAEGYPLGRWTFGAGDAVRIAGAGLYYYYIDGLDQAVVDLDKSGTLHLMLVNRSAGAKTAGAGGAILIQLGIEPTYGY